MPAFPGGRHSATVVQRRPNPGFVLNRPELRGATVLLARQPRLGRTLAV